MAVYSQLLPKYLTFFLLQLYSFKLPPCLQILIFQNQRGSLNLPMQTEKDVKPLHFLYFPTKERVTCLFSKMIPIPFPLNTQYSRVPYYLEYALSGNARLCSSRLHREARVIIISVLINKMIT